MKNSVANVMTSDNWMIKKVMQGLNGNVRIDAQIRHPQPDEDRFFSQWVTEAYANRLALENYGKKVTDFNCYEY